MDRVRAQFRHSEKAAARGWSIDRPRSCYLPAVTGAIAAVFNGSIYEREALRDSGSVIGWREKRRFFYNKVLAAAGTVTCILVISCAVISERMVGEPIGIPDAPILAPLGGIAYGLLANVCYTRGWIAELVLTRFQPGVRADAFAVRAFRLGVKFSIGLTILPALFCWGVFLFSIITGKPTPRGGTG